MSPQPRHLFIIGTDCLDSMSDADVYATINDLKTLNLYALPYDRVSVRLPTDRTLVLADEPGDDAIRIKHYRIDPVDGKIRANFGPGHWVQVDNINLLGEPVICNLVCEGTPNWRPYKLHHDLEPRTAKGITNTLIVLLATRNAVKETTHNKLAKLGIGRRKGGHRSYDYVTTIRVPEALESDPDHPPKGGTVAAHFRRGHIRHQHYGPGLEYSKPIWIAPVLVNADRDFVARRAAYNVAGGHPRKESFHV